MDGEDSAFGDREGVEEVVGRHSLVGRGVLKSFGKISDVADLESLRYVLSGVGGGDGRSIIRVDALAS